MDASAYYPLASPRLRAEAAARSAANTATVVQEIASVIARIYLTLFAGLMVWSLLPVMFGLSPIVVRTGSMQPAVMPGDVILVQHVAAAQVRVGQVVLADDPSHPGWMLSHRVIRRNDDGTLTTRGDANQAADSSPVQVSQVRGIARLRVPLIGLPAVWLWSGHTGKLACWLLLSLAAVFLSGGSAASAAARRQQQAPPSGLARVLPSSSLALLLAGFVPNTTSARSLRERPAYRSVRIPTRVPVAVG